MSESKSGAASSEFKLSSLVAILGAILAGATVTLGTLKDSFPDAGWIGVAAGVVAMAASVLGYSKSRGQVKAADVLADAAKAISTTQGASSGLSILPVPTPTTPTSSSTPRP